jgi:hypothetical protein
MRLNRRPNTEVAVEEQPRVFRVIPYCRAGDQTFLLRTVFLRYGFGSLRSPSARSSFSAIPRVAANWQQAKRGLSRERAPSLTDRQSWNSPNVLSVPSFSPRLPTTHGSPPFIATPFPFSPVVLKHREQQRGCALRHGGLLLRCRPNAACAGHSSNAGPEKSAGRTRSGHPHFAGKSEPSRTWSSPSYCTSSRRCPLLS